MISNNTSLHQTLIIYNIHSSVLDRVKTPTSKFTEDNYLWGPVNTIEDEKKITQNDDNRNTWKPTLDRCN